MLFSLKDLIDMLNEELGENFDIDELLDSSDTHFNDENYWEKREAEALKEASCVLVTVHNFPFLYAVGDIDLIARWGRLEDYKVKALVIPGDPKTFLNDKSGDKLGITSGYWACECDQNFVKTTFTTFCKKCSTCITQPSIRCKTII